LVITLTCVRPDWPCACGQSSSARTSLQTTLLRRRQAKPVSLSRSRDFATTSEQDMTWRKLHAGHGRGGLLRGWGSDLVIGVGRRALRVRSPLLEGDDSWIGRLKEQSGINSTPIGSIQRHKRNKREQNHILSHPEGMHAGCSAYKVWHCHSRVGDCCRTPNRDSV
jgi:hypothetical protein